MTHARGIGNSSSAAFALILMLLSQACMAIELIGSIVPPFPEGWKDESGACISISLGTDRICEYSIGTLRADGTLIAYIGKSAPRVDPKKGRSLVTDQLSFPRIPRGHDIVFANCERDGKRDETVLALVKTTKTEWWSQVLSAYRADLNTGRFEKIPTKGIRCLNEGWGV